MTRMDAAESSTVLAAGATEHIDVVEACGAEQQRQLAAVAPGVKGAQNWRGRFIGHNDPNRPGAALTRRSAQ